MGDEEESEPPSRIKVSEAVIITQKELRHLDEMSALVNDYWHFIDRIRAEGHIGNYPETHQKAIELQGRGYRLLHG